MHASASAAIDWTQLISLGLEMAGMGLVFMEIHRADLTRSLEGWLGAFPEKLRSIKPRDTPVWLPFWLVVGPIVAYMIYFPVKAATLTRTTLLLPTSIILFWVLQRLRRGRWWKAQPLAYLLLGPFALTNASIVWLFELLIWCVRTLLGGDRPKRLAHVGMLLALSGFAIDIYQTLMAFSLHK